MTGRSVGASRYATLAIEVGNINGAESPFRYGWEVAAKEERLLELYSEKDAAKVEGVESCENLPKSRLSSVSASDLCSRSLLKNESASLSVFRGEGETLSKARPNNRKVL
jgi:hypothetical protein